MRSSKETVATLFWHEPWSSLATGRAHDGEWEFARGGFPNSRITIRSLISHTYDVTFRRGWNGEGTVELPLGGMFEWLAIDIWRAQWAFTDAEGVRILTFKPEIKKLRHLFKHQARVEVDSKGRGLQELSLLVLLGWYLMVVGIDEAPTVAGISLPR